MNDGLVIGSEALNELTKAPIADIYNGLKDRVNLARARFLEDFRKYSDYMFVKSSQVRTLYSKNRPLNLSDVYVSTYFFQTREHRRPVGDRISNEEMSKRFASGKRIIIKGNGGSGKTFFVKWLWLQRFKSGSGRVPILVELRRVSDLLTLDIKAFCRSELQADSIFGKGVFEKLCEDGKFEFIFDGFDEVAKANRKAVERQIIELAEKFPKCSFLVSGREDDRFAAWTSFEVYDVAPMTLDEVKALVDKIPFEPKVKKKFRENLTPKFYKEHQSFLSNPLLSIMMLMTFHDNAVIPSKLTTFYDHAFQTMLTWHDATKDSFERERTLTLDEFRKVFATFCLLSYYKQAFEFDEASFRRYIESALRYHSLDRDIDGVKADMCETVNLVQPDGLKYVFVHRSFQEYFAAECAMVTISGKASEFLEFFAGKVRDSVLLMAYEIHPELFVDEFVIPRYRELLDSGFLSVLDGKRNLSGALNLRVDFMYEWLSDGKASYGIYLANYESDNYQRQLHFLSSLSRISGEYMGDEPVIAFAREMDRVLGGMREAIDKHGKKGAHIEMRITASPDGMKLSVRNRREVKIGAKDMSSIRSIVLAGARAASREADESIRTYCQSLIEFAKALVDSRAMQARSIDQILGFS